MDGEIFFGAAYKGSKQYSQQDIKTADATGFGAAADDYAERGIDLNEQLIRNKPATFFMRVSGDSMQGAGIYDGDILIVDKSLTAKTRDVIVAVIDGEFLVKRLCRQGNRVFLAAENFHYSPILIEENTDFQVWGVVTKVIHNI